MNFNFNVGDTNFIALVNPYQYHSFVDENWDLEMITEHFISETKKGNILVFQMTSEGIEADWNISVEYQLPQNLNCYRKDMGYICVTNRELCFVEYTCLTMAAQFNDEKVPDKYCERFKFTIENGIYKVDIIQYYDVDSNSRIGNGRVDIMFVLTKTECINQTEPKVYWYTY